MLSAPRAPHRPRLDANLQGQPYMCYIFVPGRGCTCSYIAYRSVSWYICIVDVLYIPCEKPTSHASPAPPACKPSRFCPTCVIICTRTCICVGDRSIVHPFPRTHSLYMYCKKNEKPTSHASPAPPGCKPSRFGPTSVIIGSRTCGYIGDISIVHALPGANSMYMYCKKGTSCASPAPPRCKPSRLTPSVDAMYMVCACSHIVANMWAVHVVVLRILVYLVIYDSG